jgi:RNA polymerase sigma factor (sigma-70 family)
MRSTAATYKITELGMSAEEQIRGIDVPTRFYAPEITMRNASESHDISAEIVELIPALEKFARRFCGRASEADDLVQETLLRALAHKDRFEPGTRLKSWLFTIMRNTFCTQARVRRREIPGILDRIGDNQSIAPTQDWHMDGLDFERAFARLPKVHRDLVASVVLEGESYEAAASHYGCALGTVKSRLNRARRQLLLDLGE